MSKDSNRLCNTVDIGPDQGSVGSTTERIRFIYFVRPLRDICSKHDKEPQVFHTHLISQHLPSCTTNRMAPATHFELNTGAQIPAVGLGKYKR